MNKQLQQEIEREGYRAGWEGRTLSSLTVSMSREKKVVFTRGYLRAVQDKNKEASNGKDAAH